MTTKVNNFFKTKKTIWITSVVAVILMLVLGTGIYLSFADGEGEGSASAGIGGGSTVNGLTPVSLHYDKFDKDGNPYQGWNEDSINWFYDNMVKYSSVMNGQHLSDRSYEKYVLSARAALQLARDNAVAAGAEPGIDARIVAVAWVGHPNNLGWDFGYMYMPDTTKSSAEWMLHGPGTTTQWVGDTSFEEAPWDSLFSEAHPEWGTWREHVYEAAIQRAIDEHGYWGDENGGLSVIVIAVARDQPGTSGSALTMEKKIDGADAANGTFAKNLFNATQNNPCYNLSGAEFTLYKSDKDWSNTTEIMEARTFDGDKASFTKSSVIYKINDDGSADTTYILPPGYYYLRETKAPTSGFYKDFDLDGIIDEKDNNEGQGMKIEVKSGKIYVNGSTTELAEKDTVSNRKLFSFEVSDPPMYDPDAINLYKRDSVTGEVSVMPEGNASLNGAQYRLSYYKGVITKVSNLPGYINDKEVDWTRANATAIWTTHSYTDALTGKVWTGKISFAEDIPSSGTWLYKAGGKNVSPLGTIAIQEVSPPEGYLIDDRIYLISITDDGTHLTNNLVHQPWQKSGLPGNEDWNNFANDYELNGDRDDIVTTFPSN